MGAMVSTRHRSNPGKSMESPPAIIEPPQDEVQKAVNFAKSASFSMSRKRSLFSQNLNKDIREAASSLSRIAVLAHECDAARNEIVLEGGFLPLKTMFLASKLPEVQATSLIAIGELCKSEECRVHVFQQGGIDLMLDGLQSKNPDVCAAATAALSNIVELEEAHQKLFEDGGVVCLLNLLDEAGATASSDDASASASDAAGHHALLTLSRMAARPAALPLLLRDGALQTAFDLAHSAVRPPEHRAAAVALIAQLCECPAAHPMLAALNGDTGLQAVIALTAAADLATAAAAAAVVAAVAAGTPALARRMLRAGAAAPPLKRLLHSRRRPEVLAALAALAALARAGPDDRDAVAWTEGLAAKLVKLRENSPDDDVSARAQDLLDLLGPAGAGAGAAGLAAGAGAGATSAAAAVGAKGRVSSSRRMLLPVDDAAG